VRNQKGAIEGLMGGDEVLEGYIKALLKRDFDRLKELLKPSDPSEETVNTFVYVILQSLRPTLEVIKSGVAHHVIDWEGNSCPICGYPPGLATLRGEGSLSLYCSLCWQGWDYKRLRCVFCSNEDPSKLGYFQVEGEMGSRVYYCDMCHGYIKTLDMRESLAISDPEEESLKTLALDILATGKGYSPKTWERI
ncbi:MAG: formate dehydrogenase accessory protein FdhE, partial [Desulfatiglandales bacterium]